MKKILHFLVVLCILLFLASCKKQNTNTYQIIEIYRITSQAGSTSFLAVDLPISYGYQSIGVIKVENADEYYYEDKGSYRTLYATINSVGKERIMTITYNVSLHSGVENWQGDMDDNYLLTSEIIDFDSNTIIELAKELTIEGDDYKTAQNISKYVSKQIKFDKETKINEIPLPASFVLEAKTGVCEDYANVMTALLRAAGIPAKNISGLVLNNLGKASDWSSPAGSHAWVEFYVDEKWHFDDPTWGNRYFANTDGYHLSYGTQPGSIYLESFQEKINEVQSKGFTVMGAMTAPIKFMAWSDDENASMIPKVDIIKQ